MEYVRYIVKCVN